MSLNAETKAAIVADYAQCENDTGSPSPCYLSQFRLLSVPELSSSLLYECLRRDMIGVE
jgi:ribosomal protein S15P/S13E